ncbi:MAG TPA: ABC transporter permease [Edaphobacter sp.]|nr:ABC transporter permease [Edaphobacter sp.]
MDDVRYAVRQLFRAPTFAIVTILTLALGVGANTAIFSVIQAVLLHPSGVQDPERVASFHAKYTQLNLPSIGVSAPDFADAQSMHAMVDAAAMVQAASFNATFDARTQHLRAARVSQQWFQVFGAEPILGRTFLPEEDQKGAERVIVLSYAAWQRMFGGEHDVVDKKVLLDDQSYRVIGVMRSDFAWPKGVELWTPLGLEPTAFAANNRFNESYNSVVKLKPGVSVAQFNAAMEQKRLEEIRREGTSGFTFGQSSGWGMFAQPWTEDAAGDLRKPLVALFAVVAMILLIACTNISGLMLARASTRMREMAIRSALGASLRQLAMQFVVETALLAGVATLIGVLAGPFLGRLLLLAIPHDLARGFAVHTDVRVVAVAAGFGLLAAFLAGVAPVVQLARTHKSLKLAEYSKSTTAGASKHRFRNVLVCTEIALAFLLVAGSGLFLASLKQLQTVDPGFKSESVLTGKVTLNATNYHDQALKQANFVRDVMERLSAQPGVVAAAAVYPAPFASQMFPSASFAIQERPPAGPDDPGPHADKGWATPRYLAAMQIPLLRGRWFSEEDRMGAPPVAVIDDMLAKAYWPGGNAIGQHIQNGKNLPPIEIVGVIGHVRRDSLEVEENKGVIYRPMAQQPVDEAVFVVRTKMNPDAMRTPLTEAVRAVDSTEAVYEVGTLGSFVGDSLAARHLLVWLLTMFGGLALLLAAIGIYGLLSFTASQRTTEIGIRMALGAQRWQVVSLMLRESLVLMGAGILAGLLLTFVAQRILIHSFAAMDSGLSLSLVVAAFSLMVAAAIASIVPARRSVSVDPVVALRNE